MSFIQLSPDSLICNPFDKIGKEWFLITAGTPDDYNTMTASWGQMGVLWRKNVFTCYVRDSRHTYQYMEKNPIFTVSFFDASYRSALSFCGANSGRDCDKAKETGLTPVSLDGTMTFAEAKQVIVCKTLFSAPLEKKDFLDETARSFYDSEALHTMYIGEILGLYGK